MTEIALILAAGASQRLAQPKQLVAVDGELLVARAIRIAREAGLEPVVVTGCAAAAVASAVDAEVVFHADWADGMGTSIAVGIRAVSARASSVTIMTCDQHAVRAEDLRRLRVAHDGSDIAAAEYDGVAGVPARFAPACFEQLAQLGGHAGARNMIRNGEFCVATVPMVRAQLDVDEPEDLEELP